MQEHTRVSLDFWIVLSVQTLTFVIGSFHLHLSVKAVSYRVSVREHPEDTFFFIAFVELGVCPMNKQKEPGRIHLVFSPRGSKWANMMAEGTPLKIDCCTPFDAFQPQNPPVTSERCSSCKSLNVDQFPSTRTAAEQGWCEAPRNHFPFSRC